MSRYTALIVALVMAGTAVVKAQTIDGTLVGDEGFYGPALSVQDTRTQFGDGVGNPDPILTGTDLGASGGSEIDQVFATVSDDRLYVLIAGNLEGNFNKMVVFIDSGNGGVNSIDGAALPGGFDSYCCGGLAPPRGSNTDNIGGLQRMHGLTFDTNFNAGYALAFTHGGETVNPGLEGEAGFWALSAHYADLTNGTAGSVGALGMQLAPRGEPRVLRAPAGPPQGDYNDDGTVNAADYVVWRNNLDTENVLPNDPVGGTIGTAQYDTWVANFGQTGSSATLGDFPFKPFGNPGNTEELVSSFTLEGLAQGELIDRNYALSANGGCLDDTGADCAAREFEFALDVDPDELGTNQSSHRNFNNFVDLRMALDNSNIEGVEGSGGPDFSFDNEAGDTDDPENVLTGIEFSIPLSAIGNPTGDIRLMAFVNSGSYDFLSNQFAGDGLVDEGDIDGLPEGNLGNNLLGDFPLATLADFTGDQFVTITQPVAAASGVVPEPTSLVLWGLALCGMLSRRRPRR